MNALRFIHPPKEANIFPPTKVCFKIVLFSEKKNSEVFYKRSGKQHSNKEKVILLVQNCLAFPLYVRIVKLKILSCIYYIDYNSTFPSKGLCGHYCLLFSKCITLNHWFLIILSLVEFIENTVFNINCSGIFFKFAATFSNPLSHSLGFVHLNPVSYQQFLSIF